MHTASRKPEPLRASVYCLLPTASLSPIVSSVNEEEVRQRKRADGDPPEQVKREKIPILLSLFQKRSCWLLTTEALKTLSRKKFLNISDFSLYTPLNNTHKSNIIYT